MIRIVIIGMIMCVIYDTMSVKILTVIQLFVKVEVRREREACRVLACMWSITNMDEQIK